MENILRTLKKFGLSDNEALVYVEALKEDELSPYQISKLTKIPRTTVYDVLMSLALKGLVELDQSDGFTKQQTKVRAINPSVLRKILQKKREDSYKLEVEIAQILPELKESFHKEESNADFKFYPGIEGAKKVYFELETYDVEEQEFSWTNLMPLDAFGNNNINEDVQKGTEIRKKNSIITKELIPLNPWTKHVMTYQYSLNHDYITTREFRYIEGSMFECYLDFLVKGDFIKIACAEGNEIWGLTMKSEALAKTFKSMYNFMWNQATPITKDLIESWGENKFLRAQKKI